MHDIEHELKGWRSLYLADMAYMCPIIDDLINEPTIDNIKERLHFIHQQRITCDEWVRKQYYVAVEMNLRDMLRFISDERFTIWDVVAKRDESEPKK